MIRYSFANASWKPKAWEVANINTLLFQLNPQLKPMRSSDLVKVAVSCRFLLAYHKSQVVGMGTLAVSTLVSGKRGHVEDVVVLENYRGQHIGKKLMELLIVEGGKLNLSRIELTSSSGRAAANNLYQSLGFNTYDTNVYYLDL